MSYPLKSLFVMLLLFPLFISAEENKGEDQLSIELLEFLAEWETADGEWIDPNEMKEDSFEQFLNVADQENHE